MNKMIYNGEVMEINSDMEKELAKFQMPETKSTGANEKSLVEQFLEDISTAKNMSEVRQIAKKLLENNKVNEDENH